jgi:tRNA(Glu) U13 pseudouridine synthase TruD
MSEHEIQKEMVQGEYDRNLEMYLATDATVAAQKSAEMRNTHAKLKMPEKVLALHQAEVASIRASWYMKILQNMYSNLESANNNLSRQITVLQLEQGISSGGNLNRGMIKSINI